MTTQELSNHPADPDEASVVDPADATSAAKLLDDIVEFLERYIVFPSRPCSRAVALWVVHTYALDAAEATPYLLITSPAKRSGKSRLLEVLELVVRQPWRLFGASEAALFRKIDHDRPTLLQDEIDAIFQSHSERTEPVRAIINAGNRRGAMVARCVGQGTNQSVADVAVLVQRALDQPSRPLGRR